LTDKGLKLKKGQNTENARFSRQKIQRTRTTLHEISRPHTDRISESIKKNSSIMSKLNQMISMNN